MKPTAKNSQNALFVYMKDDSGRFWVYDGSQYHHFFLDTQRFWYVRSQSYLPEFAVGGCVILTGFERQLLEWEAARFNLRLPFFNSKDACNGFAVNANQEQFVFDRTFPAGFFYLDGGRKK